MQMEHKVKGWGGVEWVGGRERERKRDREREKAERAKAGATDEQRKRKKNAGNKPGEWEERH